MSARTLADLIAESIEQNVQSVAVSSTAADYCSLDCEDDDGNVYIIKVIQTNVEAAEDEIDDCMDLGADEDRE